MRVLAAVALCMLTGCASEKKAALEESPGSSALANKSKSGARDVEASEPALIRSLDAARLAVGRTVRVSGKAANAKLGRVVIVDGGPIYCGEDDSWASELRSKNVVVSGVVVRESSEPPGGEISAGVTGERIRLEGCAVID